MSLQTHILDAMIAHGERCGETVRHLMEQAGRDMPTDMRLELYALTAEWLAQIAQKQVRECAGVK